MEYYEGLKVFRGTIENTYEKCEMVCNGFWKAGSRKISSYVRIDKPDNKQYSKDRFNRFWIETVD